MGEHRRNSGRHSRVPAVVAVPAVALLIALLVGVAVIATNTAVAGAATPGHVGGTVTHSDGTPAGAVAADLFTAQPAGGRDVYQASTTTSADGGYRFAVDDGCYVIVLIAPDGQQFLPTGRFFQSSVCIVDGEAVGDVNALLRDEAATVAGNIDFSAGGPVPQVTIDLFYGTGTNERAGYITSTTTNNDGSYTLSLPAVGCYQLVAIAPKGNAFVSESAFEQRQVCVAIGDRVTGIDATVASSDNAQIGGRVLNEGDAGAEGVSVDLFLSSGDGTQGAFLRSTTTDLGGRYSFDLAPGCYSLVIIAPDDGLFIDGTEFHQQTTCVTVDEVISSLDAKLLGLDESPTQLTMIELEISRLTNELRANPSGPLARRKSMPECVSEPFYAIVINPASGHPEAVQPLEVSEVVSVEMSRAWALDMQQRDAFEHRPSSSQQQIYDRVEIAAAAWGENIAWFSGYSPAETARVHFEGWRESDTGHYCSLVTSRFTHVGVGEHRVANESWGVQNFFAVR